MQSIMITSTITLSIRYPSKEGHDTVIKSENFETREKLEAYVLNFLATQHPLSADGFSVLKTCLAFRCHRIAYSLSQNPETSYGIVISSNSRPLSQKDELLQARETAKKVCKVVSNELDSSTQMNLFGFEEANAGDDFILRAFFNSSDFETVSVGPNISGTEITYTIRSSGSRV
jgi:hypothetical protein